jgi:outer membrane cobalamin receptor
MRKFKNLLMVVLLCTSATIFAQTKLSGKVVDETNQPLPGASVVVTGTQTGSSTDFDGNFSFESSATSGNVLVSFVGYESKTVAFKGTTSLGSISLKPSAETLDEIIITATSFAIDRKTPVAVSTIKATLIENKLGSQEFPEILKSTPGVYATKTGGGYGDGRINLRGFGSENVAVMINGVPVNDMENGALYWSNWAGLSDVTSAMQVQRGLGASKVAVPSIGGTINIISKSYDAEKGGSFRYGMGNDGYQKYGVSLSTGLMDNGFAATVSAARVYGNGYVDGTDFDGINYFLNLTKVINENHKLSFTAFGAQQEHGQRYNSTTIAQNRASEQGGKRFNPDWGYRDGQIEHLSHNFFHKPQISLNHYWTVSDKTNISTALYASFGNGGGGRDIGSKLGSADYRLGDFDQPIDFDTVVEENIANGTLGSTDVLSASMNGHTWYGILTTLKTDLSDELAFSGGIDARYYKGFHSYKILDLLGGQFWINDFEDNNNYNQPLKVGDTYFRDYEGSVVRGGLFAQLEYSKNDLSAFLSTAVSNTTYGRKDFINYAPSDPNRESEKADFLGYSAKGGANYNLDDTNNVFANIGYFSKAPFLTGNVFLSKVSTELNADAINEKVFSAELGYGYRSSSFSANVNVYRTSWLDKSYAGSIQHPTIQGERLEYNIAGLDALHQGIELDFSYNLTDDLRITGMASLGDWKWVSDASGEIVDESGASEGTKEVFIKDLKVSDAAQTTFALGINYNLLPKTTIALDYNYAGDIYAKYDITRRDDDTYREDSWKMPNYNLLDLNLVHGFNIGDFDAKLTANMNNTNLTL